DLSRRTTMWQYFFQVNTAENMRIMLAHDADARERGSATGLPDPEMPQPTPAEAVTAAQQKLGFALPPLLARLWTEVANGGFGPGYGLWGLDGGFAEELSDQTTVEAYLSRIDDRGYAEVHGPWPSKLVPVCDWGCSHITAIDCTTPEGEMVDVPEGIPTNARR